MADKKFLNIIAKIRTDFPAKFGIPRQSGLVPELVGKVVFEPEYRNRDFLRGIEEFSHLWLLWEFSGNPRGDYSPVVSPPRLGGKVKKGVFATRSPYRPNPVGLSSVKLEKVIFESEEGPLLVVSGADMMDGTPIYDIKPYLPYTDSHPDAKGSFGEMHKKDEIRVDFPQQLLCRIPEEKRQAVCGVLAQDPRAAYNKKPDFVYGMEFAGYDIRFRADGNCLTVCDVVDMSEGEWEKVK